jgi:hypothetical protein
MDRRGQHRDRRRRALERRDGATAIVDVTSADGTVPPLPPLADELQQVLPEAISVVVNAEVAISYPVLNQ